MAKKERKAYRAPSLVVYGRLGELTLGVGGSDPDAGNLNITCLTSQVGTVQFLCTSAPTGTGSV